MSGISIGLAINDMLSNILPGKVFPVEAQLDADMPLIVYQRDGMETGNDKDGGADIVSVTVVIIASTYKESIEIAERARAALCRTGVFAGVELSDYELTDADEGKDGAAWLQGITLKYEIE